MPIEVETPDGIAEFPDGTPPETIRDALRRRYTSQRIGEAQSQEEAFRASVNPTDTMSGLQKFAAGMGKGATDVARGIGQVVGLSDQQSIDDAKRRDAALMQTGAGLTGNIAGSVAALAPTMMIPGANTLAGSALIGAASGALEPVASDESRLAKTLMGGAGAIGGDLVSRGLSRALNPRTASNVRTLMDGGVTPTPGQIMGGRWNKLESALESWPLAGPGVSGAKAAVTEEFNEATLNRVLAPIGKKISATGHEGVRLAREAVESAYDDAYALIPTAQIDPQFALAVSRAKQAATALVPDRAKQLDGIIENEISRRIGGQSQITGEMLHTIESQIKAEAAALGRTPGYDEQKMSQALRELVGEIRGLAARNSPDAADLLKKADNSYAMLLRAEQAAGLQGAPNGIFTPNQLGSAIRNMDPSLRRKDISHGEGLMQDWTTAARDVMGGGLPNSGTADRALAAALMSGRGSWKDLAGLMATGGAYSDPGRKLLAAALAKRTPGTRAAGDLVRRLKPAIAGTGAQLTNE